MIALSWSFLYIQILISIAIALGALALTVFEILPLKVLIGLIPILILLAVLRNSIYLRTCADGCSKKTDVNIKKKIEKNKENILLIISKHPKIIDAEIAELLSIGTDVVKFHLEELRKSKLAKIAHIQGSDWEGIPYREEWSTDQLGRKYLMHHKLIK